MSAVRSRILVAVFCCMISCLRAVRMCSDHAVVDQTHSAESQRRVAKEDSIYVFITCFAIVMMVLGILSAEFRVASARELSSAFSINALACHSPPKNTTQLIKL